MAAEREKLRSLKDTISTQNPSPAVNFTLAMFEMLIRHDQQLESIDDQLKSLARWRRAQTTMMFSVVASIIVVLLTALLV